MSEDERYNRISQLLAKLNQPQSSHRTQTSLDCLSAPPPPEMRGTNTTDLLSRVQAFLPNLKAANDDLDRRARENPAAVDMEALDGEERAYIELNLGLGLFEQLSPTSAASRRSSSSSSGDGTSQSNSHSTTSRDSDNSNEEEDDSDNNNDDDDDEVSRPDLIALVTGTRPVRPLPKTRKPRHHPGIVVLSSTDADADPPQVESSGESRNVEAQLRQ